MLADSAGLKASIAACHRSSMGKSSTGSRGRRRPLAPPHLPPRPSVCSSPRRPPGPWVSGAIDVPVAHSGCGSCAVANIGNDRQLVNPRTEQISGLCDRVGEKREPPYKPRCTGHVSACGKRASWRGSQEPASRPDGTGCGGDERHDSAAAPLTPSVSSRVSSVGRDRRAGYRLTSVPLSLTATSPAPKSNVMPSVLLMVIVSPDRLTLMSVPSISPVSVSVRPSRSV
jgi:hypothetical protein